MRELQVKKLQLENNNLRVLSADGAVWANSFCEPIEDANATVRHTVIVARNTFSLMTNPSNMNFSM
jgi:hypothetical protein